MVGIILSILKIIGIIILCILGLILAILLLVLLCPVRYKVNATNEENIEGKVKVTWLLHFIVAEVIYKQGINIRFKVLGIPFYDKKRKDEKLKRKEEKNSNKKSAKDDFEIAKEEPSFENKDSNNISCEDNNSFENITNASDSNIVIDESKDSEANSPEPNNSDINSEDSVKKEKRNYFKIIYDFIVSIPDRFASFLENANEKVNEGIDTVSYYHRILTSKGTEDVITYVKSAVFKILKHIRPRKSNIVIKFGSTDPDKMGSICAYYGIASAYLPKRTYLYPDFEDDYFKFTAKIKGRIILGYLAIVGLKMLLNKKIKKFIKLMKRENKNGRK